MTRPDLSHRYVAELAVDDGSRLSTPPLQVDWTPVVEWSHFQDVRHGHAGLASAPGRVRIEPRWDDRSGPPYVAALRVSPCNESAGAEEIPLEFLAGPVQQAVGALVETGRIPEAAKYSWRVCAFEAKTHTTLAPLREPFTIEQSSPPDDVSNPRRLGDLLSRAVRRGPASTQSDCDFPVFVSRSIVDESIGAAQQAGELETGGVLLGTVSRAEDSSDLVLEITAQVPASEAIAEAASLRFTPQTWQAVAAAIRLRSARERIVGWWHSHPRKVWACHACPSERRALCPLNRPFFSSMDVMFHRAAFQAPLNVALLLSFHDEPTPRVDLFGWRQGMIAARDYYVLEERT